jgi:hypothetical protein
MRITASAMPWVRAGIGLLQGLALFALAQASEQHVWPATDGLLFAPLFTLAIFLPLLVISGLGKSPLAHSYAVARRRRCGVRGVCRP